MILELVDIIFTKSSKNMIKLGINFNTQWINQV